MVSITLNGKPRQIDRALNVPALLSTLDVNPKQVAVAINGEVVPRGEWPDVTIVDGDIVEIVRAVGGG